MEKRNKFKILKRILPIICAFLCIATALTTPISAIVDSSGGTGQNYDITGRSTFPMTVGLAFELDEGNNVTFASDIGGYGQEYNTTQGGTDTFFWTSNASTASQLEGQLEYEFLATRVQDKEYRNSFPLMTNYGYSKASYRPIRITTKAGSDLTNGKDCSSVVYRMSDVVINSTVIRVGNYIGNLQDDFDIDLDNADSIRNSNAYRPNPEDYQYLVPHVVLPGISTTAGYYGRYNVIATITDEWGKQWDLNYSIPVDTKGAIADTLVPFLPMSIFDSYGKTKGDIAYNIGMSHTVVLNEYYGYLDVDYYEYKNTIPELDLVVNLKAEVGGEDTLIRRDFLPLGEYVGKTFNEWISAVDGQNGYTVTGGAGGITMTYTDTDNDFTYSGIITNSNGANVYGTTIISEDEVYIANLYRESSIPPTQIIFALGNMSEMVDISELNGKTWSEALKSYSLPEGFLVGENDTRVQLIYHPSDSAWYSGYIVSDGNYVSSSTVITAGTLYTCSMSAIDDPLIGTWVIGDFSSNPNAFNCHLNFTSNGQSFKTFTAALNYYIYYTPTSGDSDVFAYQNGSWTHNGYKSITITTPYDDIIESQAKLMLQFLSNYATRTSVANVASTMVYFVDAEDDVMAITSLASTDTPITTATAGWVKVEGTEYGRSAMLTLPLWDTSHWTNTNNSDYKVYSLPTVQKFLTDVQKSTNIPTDIQQDYTSWIGTATAGFLNMELMPNFSIGGVLAILIGFSIVMLFLKYFAGG